MRRYSAVPRGFKHMLLGGITSVFIVTGGIFAMPSGAAAGRSQVPPPTIQLSGNGIDIFKAFADFGSCTALPLEICYLYQDGTVVGQFSASSVLNSILADLPADVADLLEALPGASQLTGACTQVPSLGDSDDLTEVANNTSSVIVLVGGGCVGRSAILTSGPEDLVVTIAPGDDDLVDPPLAPVSEAFCTAGPSVDC